MKPAPFDYYAPTSLAEAAGLLARLDNAKLIAGGQSLGPMMNFRYVIADHLVDLGGIPEIAGIALAGETLRIGATTPQRELEFSDVVAQRCPLLKAALKHVGHRQTRNRGTFGGSVAHFDPASEQPMMCAAHDAVIEIASVRGTRRVPFAEFGVDFMTTALEPDEILAAIELPLWPQGHGWGFHEFARRHGDFAIVAAAALLALGPDGRIARASLTLAGVAVVPLRLREAEAALIGHAPEMAPIEAAADLAGAIAPLADIHASADYRRHLARILTGRALADAAARAAGRSVP
ncbi:FAD binding domain-containing protein [Xanthobacter tagetidis]|uniref:Xanthine dehydrogenase family protein subunit M n=1 Tax=Xanthobacter tagetidis TaxID=60216 RepID=A0A3L7AB99_9HYPH|nr:FAD binding domain-containing protein [Xanthobacter tagetidis]MBB6306052.1 carbon-monoxide dehydrogenase medium subunit [Xanthobacter tagetidis]RLP77613.1 xanthine dehydrogenase family protein subunit M [Xanthobacter tagetidis]